MALVRVDSPFEIMKNNLEVHGDQGNVHIFDYMQRFVNSCIFLKLIVLYSVGQVQPPSWLLYYPFNSYVWIESVYVCKLVRHTSS